MDKHYDISCDTGDKVIQCGRHNDVFKLWLQWRSKGTESFEKQQDRLMDLARYQVHRIREQSDRFGLIMEPECVNVSCWYIPKRLRGVPHDGRKGQELGKMCPIIKGRMMQKGSLKPLSKSKRVLSKRVFIGKMADCTRLK